jgi:putative Mg2+ transporter-C (MgtC) family protein
MGFTTISLQEVTLRLALSFVAGGIIGMERSSKHQTAGLKTHILISVGAAILMLLSIWVPETILPAAANGVKNGDPGRIAAQVVSGIGFLGAGAMIRLGNNIRGLTTATTLWLSAALGLALGAGMYFVAAIGAVLAIITLFAVDHLENIFFPKERNKLLVLHYQSEPDINQAVSILKGHKIRVQTFDIDETEDQESRLRILIGLPSQIDIENLARELRANGNVTKFEMKEDY